MLGTFIGIFLFGYALSQQTGDYRSAATGNWSAASTWEVFDGVNWVPAATPPTGTETITVDGVDTVAVDVAVAITGYLAVTETGVLGITSGSLAFGNGSTYEHARDGGSVPPSTWETGSTALFTGITATAPDNRGQDYYNLTFNTPGLTSNRDMSLDGNTISGDITVISTGSARWQMVGGSSGTVTIMGDVIVQAGQFATQGTGSATDVIVDHHGSINVTGGNFSISRGSQGSGSGTTTWYLHEGNFWMSDATTQNSNPTPGNAKFVFAKGSAQQLAFVNVTYGGGDVHFEVSDTTTLQITQNFAANGLFVNKGVIETLGTLTFLDGAVYEHARDGGSVPTATWETGSTALFSGITATAPDNRGQDYYNLTLNTPGLTSNRDLSLDGNTIGGDITVINTGSARWQMVGGSSGTVTIMGDVIVQAGQFTTQGTGSATDVIIDHYGDINVTGGNFSVSRGSQGSGTGTTTWNLHVGNFSMSDATTQNSNPTPGNAKFVFANIGGMQNLTLSNVTYGGGGLPIQVDSAATVNMESSVVGGNDIFTLSNHATLATAHVGGIAGALQTTGAITLSQEANFTFNGTAAQITSTAMPDTINDLTIDNAAGVTLSRETEINGVLSLVAGVFDNTIPFTLGPSGSIAYLGGSLLFPIVSIEDPLPSLIPAEFALFQNYPNPFNPATTIRYHVPKQSRVIIKVYDVVGREVAELVNDDHAAGAYTITWNAREYASGVYYYRMSAGDFVSVRKLVLMK